MLSVLFLIAVISPRSCFSFMDASTVSSMLASPLPLSFLDTYSLSTSSLGCNTLCMVISFFVLWSICLSSSLVHLRKGPEYLTRGTAQVFIPLMRFLLESFVSSSFLVLLRYSFRIYYYYHYYHYYYFNSYNLSWGASAPVSAAGLLIKLRITVLPRIFLF